MLGNLYSLQKLINFSNSPKVQVLKVCTWKFPTFCPFKYYCTSR
uniref:Uncharacterized protein n=1 Tax=Anguilla anguilla TaxID=7936 RepID=A0A0E9QA74_ANGAN